MNANEETCVLCPKKCDYIVSESEDSIEITQKAVKSINSASVKRGDSIIVAAGMKVHRLRHLNYRSNRCFEGHKKAKKNNYILHELSKDVQMSHSGLVIAKQTAYSLRKVCFV